MGAAERGILLSPKKDISSSTLHEGTAQHRASGKDAGAIIIGLVKAVKALQTYGTGHATFRQFFTPLYQNLLAFLKENREVSFQIEQDAILHENRVLYREQEKDVSIPFRLFRDGIRDIDFVEGLSPDELLSFLNIVSQPLNEYDIAVNLWEADFAHIGFYVVEEDDALYDSAIPDAPSADIDFDQKMSALLKQENIDLDTPLTSQLSPDEFEKLKMYIADTEQDSSLSLLVEVLVDFIGTDALNEAIDGLKNILTICLQNRDFLQATQIVTTLKDCRADNVLEILEDEAMIVSFKEAATTAHDEKFDEFAQFIKLLPKKSIPHLFKMLAGITRRDRVTKVQELILVLAQGDPSSIAPALSSEDHTVVMTAIAVIAMMKTKEAASYLQPLVYHREPKVRWSALTALEHIAIPSMIAVFLDDPLGDIRIKALTILAHLEYPKIYSKLLQIIKSNDFLFTDPNEQQAYFNCLVANGGDSLIADLKDILYKKFFWGNTRYRSIRSLAAIALAAIGSVDALETLRLGIQNRQKDIRAACKKGIAKKNEHGND
jgi:HEAT repeat protein